MSHSRPEPGLQPRQQRNPVVLPLCSGVRSQAEPGWGRGGSVGLACGSVPCGPSATPRAHLSPHPDFAQVTRGKDTDSPTF